MTEAKKKLFAQLKNAKRVLNLSPEELDNSLSFVEHDTFVAQLAERLRMLSDESRLNAMLEILAILNQFTRVEGTTEAQ